MTKNNGYGLQRSGTKHNMGRTTRLLLIGAPAHRDALGAALPGCDIQIAEAPLDGLWQGGRTAYERAFVSLDTGVKALRAVAGLRQVAPRMRIVVGCRPSDEPLARRALAEGADEYILEPIRREDVEKAFGEVQARKRTAIREATPGPTPMELNRLSDILRNLGDGVEVTLQRMAELVKDAFEAEGVLIEFDGTSAAKGQADDLVLEEALVHTAKPVGRVALARRSRGAYAAGAASRLAEYARLIEATIAQARERQRWRDLAWTDDLSGLNNRRFFEESLVRLLGHAAENRLRLTVLLFDIDGFKSYNDRFGHDVGDKLIQEVAVLLRRCSRRQDIVARYGGDEFAVIFWDAERQRVPGSEHPHEPIELAARFCKAISEHDFSCLGVEAPGPVTISGGLACFPWNGSTRHELIAAADEALLRAKQTGKNRIQLAGESSVSPAAG